MLIKSNLSNKSYFLFIAFCLLFAAPLAQAQKSLPELEITFPTDGYVFGDIENLSISFTADMFVFVDYKSNREPFPGNSNAGHAHLWVVPADFKGELNHDAAKKILQDFRPEKFTVEEPGKYRAIMELTQNHHLAYDPPVRAEVTFVVGQPALGNEVGAAIFSGDDFYSKAAMGLIGLLVLLLILKAVLYFKNKNKVEDALPMSEAGGNNSARHSIPHK